MRQALFGEDHTVFDQFTREPSSLHIDSAKAGTVRLYIFIFILNPCKNVVELLLLFVEKLHSEFAIVNKEVHDRVGQ